MTGLGTANKGRCGVRAFGEAIQDDLEDLVSEWVRIAVEEEYQSNFTTRDELIDGLPALIAGIATAALQEPLAPEAHMDKIGRAAEHGSERRSQGLPEHVIFDDYRFLQRAVSSYLWARFGRGAKVTEAILRFDAATSTASSASLFGYFRAEIEGTGQWREGLSKIVDTALQHSRGLRPPQDD